MIKEAIGVGDDLEQAKAKACAEIGVDVSMAEFEILQKPEKKKFGLFGGCPAKVRAYIVLTPVDVSKKYLSDVLKCMGVDDIEIEVTETEEGAEFNLSGENIGSVIGRRGETLDALQYLTGLVANHVDNTYFRITINTGNYREKREKTLEALGRKHAFNAAKKGVTFSLEPMNPYERRIIHTAVQKVKGAVSWSEGENMARHVVIGPDPNAPKRHSYHKDNSGYNKYKGSSNRRSSGFKKKYSNYSSYSKREKEENSAPAERVNDNPSVPVYGKIDID